MQPKGLTPDSWPRDRKEHRIAPKQSTLVVLQLASGNATLNTVIPYDDPVY